MKLRNTLSGMILASLASGAIACETCKKDFIFGMPTAMGNGMAFSWVKLDKTTKKPVSLGVTLTETALTGLPEKIDGPMPMMEFMVDMPGKVQGIPFNHLTIDWNPQGHEPNPIYGVAHFDFHFYTLTPSQRAQITLKGESMNKARKAPPAGFMPAGYFHAPQTEVPTMGSHWVDLTSPELKGAPFTTTFIYGSYDGGLAFYEPMIALSYLQSKPVFEQELKVPTSYAKSGYYPTKYKISYSESRKEYTISLEGLEYRTASSGVVAKK